MNETELKKLTVPQLKLICKEKRITGYSKLGKSDIIGKLVNWQRSQAAATGNNSQLDAVNTDASGLQILTIDASTPRLDTSLVSALPVDPKSFIACANSVAVVVSAAETQDNHGSVSAISLPMDKGLQQNATLVSLQASRTGQSSSTLAKTEKMPLASRKRSLDGEESFRSKKKTRIDELQPRPIDSTPLLKVPELSERAKLMLPPVQVNYSKINEAQSSDTVKKPSISSLKVHPGISVSRAFKTLVPIASQNVTTWNRPLSTYGSSEISTNNRNLISSLSGYLDFSPEKVVELGPIALAPSILQRKHAANLALILSGISVQDLTACAQVSRLFRYSAYLSAAHQLSRRFPGSRLEDVLARFSPKTTNLWPYLRQREHEVLKRKRIYEQSFLARALKGLCSIAEDLWSSPDNEKQTTIAIRFLLTRLFFLVSVGYGSDQTNLAKGAVVDAQEVVPNEIWRITFHSTHSMDTFFVLEATCEIIGQPSSARVIAHNQPRLREDWRAYIAIRQQDESRIHSKQPILTLLEHLHWTNHEEYSTGISKLWLSRLKAEGEAGGSKSTVAWRYVLACVVSNSVSGRWLTSNEMAQDFNGLSTSLPPRERTRQRLNLFLPAYHHVESLHFTSAHGQVLHSALAVVQTPGREFYILKDNGMQVGCEEEGVAPVWMELLGC
ncbi:hypothetical protein BYT27DRAFT_7150139, partial [Phlegmacium glaucopus]